jgi:hypothetical protein
MSVFASSTLAKNGGLSSVMFSTPPATETFGLTVRLAKTS